MSRAYMLKGKPEALLPLGTADLMTDRGARVLDFEDALEEYHFMRSFGMGHARACARVGWNPEGFARAAQRAGKPITQ